MSCVIYGADQNGEAMWGNTLAQSSDWHDSFELDPHPNITNRLPRLEETSTVMNAELSCTDLKASANFAGRTARNGSVKKATPKQTAAPTRHPKKPRNLPTDG
jgi:hypothetical protein